MSNLEQMPETLGRIRQEMLSLKQATGDVWKRFTKLPEKNLFSTVSEDMFTASEQLKVLNKQSGQLEKINKSREKLATDGPTLFNTQYSINKRAKKLKKQGVNTDKAPEALAEINNKKQPVIENLIKLRQQRTDLIEQKGAAVGTQYKNRADKISQLSNASAKAKAFAQPKLELAKNLLKPGADLEAGLSEVQALLHLNNGDPRTAALRQQSLSMAASGHAPSDVVAKQKELAKGGMNADQVLAETPAALNGATPAEQMAVTVKGDNLDGDITKLFASWATIRINLFAGQSDALRQLTQTATGWLNTLNTWITDNPQMVNALLGLALGVTGLISGLGFLGGVIAPVLSGVNMLMAGAGLLGTVFSTVGATIAAAFAVIGWPVIALIALIVGVGVAIAKLWEPIKAFVGGVIEGFSSVLGPIGEAFAPFKTAFNLITDLLKPIKYTQSELQNLSNSGQQLGEMFARVLTLPTKLFGLLRSEISSLLQKLNFFKNSDDDENKADMGNQPQTAAIESAAQATSLTTNYQAVKSANSSSTVNNSSVMNNQITITEANDPHATARLLTDHLSQEKQRQELAALSGF
ncbi:phage tail tape measure protein [Ewingella allii]|uniref:phage tail tape measure protein n=1 Tax=Ewingella allii TaxID=3092550 RepID=UPI0037913A76